MASSSVHCPSMWCICLLSPHYDFVCIDAPGVVFHALYLFKGIAGEVHARQAAATIESINPYARDGIWYRHACKPDTVPERKAPDARHRVWYRNARQVAAADERIIPDARNAVRDRQTNNLFAVEI